MKIIYVAKHNSGDNNDEDAIVHALVNLGHNVVPIKEAHGSVALRLKGDFLLFHKWEDYESISKINIPKVFWYFDLVHSDDPIFVEKRNSVRLDWIQAITGLVDLGFCTDGDWVAQDKTGKLVHLLQGADERFVGPGRANSVEVAPIVFTGLVENGLRRMRHVEELREHFGSLFDVVGDGGRRSRRHGKALADLFASTKIAIAPDGPNTDRYWSNRVYLTLGLHGFLIHPYCQLLTEHYQPDTELAYYSSHEELIDKVNYFLMHEEERTKLRQAGYEKTLQCHLYRHRCERLIEIVKERLNYA